MLNAFNIVRLFISRTPEKFVENAGLLGRSVQSNRHVIDDFSSQGFNYNLELSSVGVTRRFRIRHVYRTCELQYDRQKHEQAASNVVSRAKILGLVLAT